VFGFLLYVFTFINMYRWGWPGGAAEHIHTHTLAHTHTYSKRASEREDWGMLAKVLRLSQETIGVEVKCGWVVCLARWWMDIQ
jgi:hypothetical protein